MSQSLPFRKADTAVVAANGTATIKFQPTSYGEEWTVGTVGVQLTVVPTTGTPQALVYIDGDFISGSVTPDMDTDSAFNQIVHTQSVLRIVFTGCVSGSTATVTITGVKTVQ